MRLILVVDRHPGPALATYVGISGYFLAHAAAACLKVGSLCRRPATAEPPTDPLALGYRGDPMAALSLPFQTVSWTTPLVPPRPGSSPPQA
jgi:hypothetical protein